MKHVAVKVGLGLTLALGAAPAVSPASAHAEVLRTVAPAHGIEVGGDGVTLSPAFDPAITRYSVRTGEGTDGRVTVAASTSDPDGRVLVDGAEVDGPTELTGLTAGDEISVIIEDGAATTAYALIVVPPTFPNLTATVNDPSADVGTTLLTFRSWIAAVDRHGVPVVVDDLGDAVHDFKPAPGGHYSVARCVDDCVFPKEGDWEILELDETLAPVVSHRVLAPGGGFANTNFHDSILRADGSRILIGYEDNATTGLVDAVIQEVASDGQIVYTWNSADHVDVATETTATAAGVTDYAHLNSVEVLPDGDVLASFRHLSAAFKIAWSAHDGYQRGDVVWRFGGRLSDFDFPDDPDGGPCAQHTVRPLANGHLVLFDNGSLDNSPAAPSFCVDPSDRTGATVARGSTRVTEYALESEPTGSAQGVARLVSSYEPDRFAMFAGSAQRLAAGDTLIGWSAYQGAVASQVDAAGEEVWKLVDSAVQVGNYSNMSYRAARGEVADAIKPEARLILPRGARYEVGEAVTPEVACTDRGGSTLQSCRVTAVRTGSAGTRTATVTAVDGAGNRTTARATYTVLGLRPTLRARSGGAWAESAEVRTPRVGSSRRVKVRITNEALRARRYVVAAPTRSVAHRWAYRVGQRNVSGAINRGTWRTPRLAPGASLTLTVKVRRTAVSAPLVSGVKLRATAAGTDASRSLRIRVQR
ncbi:hypothetical protein E8D34_02490 [Nocardioides sp. GY 10113]|uniref:arylsulfotransferase family protein n=1 Tax=Nocardioides sp. GY 10113 TaxID=2569761 RepID=UPI0010A77422|nr:aryl-sulfate sulfotransferase [Nocardioides sp. GY 10113]TIC88574.1 hypothetical protein E8D34_02490 [Nocardioides sp. GY 10113]